MARDTEEAAARVIKELWREAHPDDPRQPCRSAVCIAFATRRVHWPGTLPGEAFPLYCEGCAAGVVKLARTLGYRCETERLPQPTTSRRGIATGEVPI